MKYTTKIFKPRTPYLYNSGDFVNNMEILTQTYIENKNGHRIKAYNVKCLKCNGTTIKTEYQLKDGVTCGVCNGKVVIKGINDVATTHPHLVKFFKNKEQANVVTYSSGKKYDMICPICGKTEKKMYLYNLDRQGYSCPFCGDKISYPEKFIANFLEQLKIDFIPQLSKSIFSWCKKYKYDFYIEKYNMIIETHGLQHYEENCDFSITLKEQQEIDNIKMKLALDNGIKHYVVLDCRESNLKWIKKSIIDSSLQNIFKNNFNNVDWNKINFNSTSSDIVKACELWNKNKNLTTKDIGKILKHTPGTINYYLKKGVEVGICDYTAREGQKRANASLLKYNSMPVYFNEVVYASSLEFAKIIGASSTSVSNWLNGKHKPKGKYAIYSSARYATEEEVKKYINKMS